MKGLVGPFENSFEKQARIDLLIKKLGIEGYNSFLEKLFYKKIPKDEDFQIPLIVKNENFGLIKIQGYRPIEMVIRNQDGDDSVYKLDGDPDMASIVCHYLM